MQEVQTEIGCRHPICKCPPQADGDYCGDYCKSADKSGTPDVICECGHPECQPQTI